MILMHLINKCIYTIIINTYNDLTDSSLPAAHIVTTNNCFTGKPIIWYNIMFTLYRCRVKVTLET